MLITYICLLPPYHDLIVIAQVILGLFAFFPAGQFQLALLLLLSGQIYVLGNS